MFEHLPVLLGMKMQTIFSSFFGALVSLRFIRAETWWGRAMLVIGGFGGAAYGTPIILHALEWPIAYEPGAAFLLGMFGMSICDAVARAVAAADLWSVIRGWLEKKQ